MTTSIPLFGFYAVFAAILTDQALSATFRFALIEEEGRRSSFLSKMVVNEDAHYVRDGKDNGNPGDDRTKHQAASPYRFFARKAATFSGVTPSFSFRKASTDP